jgi:para-nitrobenzyl esterase
MTMIRIAISAALAVTALSSAAFAAEPAKTAAPAATAPAQAKYTTADTEIGTLLDDPAARAILDKYVPEMTANDQIEMARAMTLKSIQAYAPDDLTDELLAKLDAEFAKLK